MRKHLHTHITHHFTVLAKSLKKGDQIRIGRRTYTVKSNVKNDYGKRVLELGWGTKKEKDAVTLVVRGKAEFDVIERETIHTK